MKYISITELRTKSRELIRSLKHGDSVSLIHRSKVVGVIAPSKKDEYQPVDVSSLEEFLNRAKPEKLIPIPDRERVYRKHLLEKHGRGLS